MVTLTTCIVLATIASPQATKQFRDQRLGLVFDYPASWTLRRENLFQILEFEIRGKRASVQLINTDFRGTKEQWQTGMVDVNRAGGREVLRQSEEELLGVPLLLTRATDVNSGQRRILLIGLLYSKSNEKLNFRVTAPADIFNDAETQWRECLLSIRTLSGQLPSAEDGTRPSQTPTGGSEAQPPKNQKKTVWTPGASQGQGKAEQKLKLNASYNALLPAGWTLTEGKLGHPRLQGKLTLDGLQGDRGTADASWDRLVRADLAEFRVVRRREEPRPTAQASGYTVRSLWRSGEGAAGPRATFIAVGYGETRHWMLTYEAKDLATLEADLVLIRSLLPLLQIEPLS